MAHEGSFEADGIEFNYKAISFRDEITERETEDVTSRELKRPGYIIFEIENVETGKQSYETINGPWEDWEQIEDFLQADWGDEGSRRPEAVT